MYLNHYNLRLKPFSTNPDPRFLWLSEKHREALAVLKYGILEEKGFLLLTGDIGTGKTSLINVLVKKIDIAALVATVSNPGLSSIDFFNFLAGEFKMGRQFETKGQFLIYFKQFLYTVHKGNRKILLIIDEAHRLNHQLLEQIRLLSNIEIEGRQLINIFFVGQSEFNSMLTKTSNQAVRQRITVSHHLDPLTEAETATYIHHRLKVAGATHDIFSASAVRKVFLFSKGNPRLINSICDHALLDGFAAKVTTIDKKTIKKCVTELGKNTNAHPFLNTARPYVPASGMVRSSQKQKIALGLAATLFLSVAAAYFVYNLRFEDSPRWTVEDIAAKKKLTYSEKEKKALIDKMTEINRGPQKQSLVQPRPEPARVEKNAAGAGDDHTIAKNAAQPTQRAAALKLLGDLTMSGIPGQSPKVLIHFLHNSNELTDQAFETLDQIIWFASQNPEAEIIIKGYTDSYGDYRYNKELSRYRANIIKSYFAGQGIASTRIKTFGMGPENPMAPNDTFEGRKQNRRVEININLNE